MLSSSYPQRLELIRNLVRTDIIGRITNNQDLVAACVADNIMPLWIRCFNTPLVSADNYDVIEKLGDAVLELCTVDKLLVDNPYTTPGAINDAVTYYASNKFIYELMPRIPVTIMTGKKLGDFLATEKDLMISDHLHWTVVADLYEAILGTVKAVVSIVAHGRIGYDFANEWYLYTLRQNGITRLEDTKGNGMTILHQIFTRFSEAGINIDVRLSKKGKPTEIPLPGDDVYKRVVIGYYYYLTADDIDILNSLGARLPTGKDLILVPSNYKQPNNIRTQEPFVIGYDKVVAKENAANEALEFLKNYGVTPEWAARVKTEREIANYGSDVKARFDAKIKQLGYHGYNIKVLTTGKYSTEGSKIVQLFGVIKHPNGMSENVLLFSVPGGGNTYEIKKELVMRFISM